MDAESTVINLDSLNKKQKTKEFKNTIKEIKASDITKKKEALEKLNRDSRYFLEGECLIPFLESLVPKKKSLEYIKLGLETLNNFLDSTDSSGSKMCTSTLEFLVTISGSLSVFRILLYIVTYEEEQKKKKKNEEIPPDELGDLVRFLGMKALNVIATCALENDSYGMEFAKVENILLTLATLTVKLANRIKNKPDDKVLCVQGLKNVLSGVYVALCKGVDSLQVLSTVDDFFTTCHDLMTDSQLTLQCLQIFNFIATQSDGVAIVSQERSVDLLLSTIEGIAAKWKLSDDAAAPAAGTATGKGGKGKAVAKSESASLSNVNNNVDGKVDDILLILTSVNVLVIISTESKGTVNSDFVSRVVKSMSQVLLNKDVWSACAKNLHLSKFPLQGGVLLGSFGLISEDIRDIAVGFGVLKTLVNVLRSSSTIFGVTDRSAPDYAEKMDLCYQFRHIIEKSMLHLLCLNTTQVLSNTRWNACSAYESQLSAVNSTRDALDETKSGNTVLQDIFELVVHEDLDINHRAIRIIAAVALSDVSKSILSHINNSQLMTSFTTKLSNLFLKVASSLVASKSAEITQSEITVNESIENDFMQIPLPTVYDSVSYIICIMEIFAPSSKEALQLFATDENILVMADMLYCCGPIFKNQLNTNFQENIFKLQDPRYYDWTRKGDASSLGDSVILRVLVYDILAILAEAESKYRVYENDSLPQQPCVPYPAYTSECMDISIQVFRTCSNPCIATLMCCSSVEIYNDRIFAKPSYQHMNDAPICSDVCDAALRLLESISSSGLQGLVQMYAVIASGFGSRDKNNVQRFSPLCTVREFFAENSIATDIHNEYEWEVPAYFHIQESNDLSLTHLQYVLTRKDLWIYFPVVIALLGILANPSTRVSTMRGALKVVKLIGRVNDVSDVIQPAFVDYFNAILLGIGGGVILPGCLGRFGHLEPTENDIEFILYLINRGSTRETFWLDYRKKCELESAAAASASDGKSKNAKDAKAKDTKAKEDAKQKDTKPKDAKKNNKDEKKKSAFIELKLPFEPDSEFPDPNHAPNRTQWTPYINFAAMDLYNKCCQCNPLSTALQSGLSRIASCLIDAGAEVNLLDGNGCSPLMHALVLGDENSVSKLLENTSNCDMVDKFGNPTFKYAFFSLSQESLHSVISSASNNVISGQQRFMSNLISRKVDLNVSDEIDGNFAVHFACRIGMLEYVIGGTKILINSDRSVNCNEISLDFLLSLYDAGAVFDCVNKHGVAPLHILAAQGNDIAVQQLLKFGISPNIRDENGYTPLHYAAGCCSGSCVAVAEHLLVKGNLRPYIDLPYNDKRNGKLSHEKYEIDATSIIENILSESFCPLAISMKRIDVSELIVAKSNLGYSPIALAIIGNALLGLQLNDLLEIQSSDAVNRRINMFMYLTSSFRNAPSTILTYLQTEQLSAVHAFMLFYADICRCGIDNIPSLITDIMNMILNDSSLSGAFNVGCLLKTSLPITEVWTPLHCAIYSGATSLVNSVLERSSIYSFPYVHYIASLPFVSEDIAFSIVNKASTSPVHGTLLNTRNTVLNFIPLHRAIEMGNLFVVQALLSVPQTEPNVVDLNGRTPFYAACLTNNLPLISVFIDFADKIDFMVEDIGCKTVIDFVISEKNVDLLNILLSMRRNDVIERLLVLQDNVECCNQSHLNLLEKENMALYEAWKISKDNLSDDFTSGAQELEASNQFLKIILGVLKATNLLSSDSHLHNCFFDGEVYSEFAGSISNASCSNEF